MEGSQPGGAAHRVGAMEDVGFFGALVHRQSYLNLVYLMLAFPMGIFYFVVTVTGLALGFGLAILGVGLLILLFMMVAMRGFAAVERQLGQWLLDVDIPPPEPGPDPWHHPLQALRKYAGDSYTWKSLAYILLKFPFGILSFVLLVTMLALTMSLILAPVLYSFVPIDIVFWRITTADGALLCLVFGLVLAVLAVHAINGLAAVWRLLAVSMLAGGAPARRVELKGGPIIIP